MSSPSINRWGLNLFWYRYWFADKNNAQIVHQGDLINRLILIYIHYGLVNPQNIFVSKYWYGSLTKQATSTRSDVSSKYFRIAEYRSKIATERRSHRVRIKLKNIYFSKIWILRYQNWLVINFYCFQPMKKRAVTRGVAVRKFDTHLIEHGRRSFALQRFKATSALILSNTLRYSRYFNF